MIRSKKENHRKNQQHFQLHPSNVPHAIAHLVPRLEWLELRPFSLRAHFFCTLPILPTGLHSRLDDPYSLSVGHVNMSLSTLGCEMSIIYSRDCSQSVDIIQSI